MSDPKSKPIAVVCDTVPYPTRSGDNQRLAELISVLREEGWKIHLVLCGFLDSHSKKLAQTHVDRLFVCSGTGVRTLVRNLLRRLVRVLDRCGRVIGLPPLEEIAKWILGRSIAPIIMDYWERYPQGLDKFIGKLAIEHCWGTVIVEYIWLYKAVANLNGRIQRILDTHDIQHKRIQEFASRGLSFPLQITREEESKILSGFDAVIAIQSAEAELIREMCPGLEVLTVGSSCTDHRIVINTEIDGRVLYVGGYNGANIDGLNRFLKFIWPRIHARSPRAHLHICGYIYRAFLSQQFENVKFLGHKDSIESEYAEASVVINPVWIGTGLKIKTVEALARGKPLVTTAKGIEGIVGVDTQCVLLGDDDEDFAGHLLTLLDDREARTRLSKAAQHFSRVQLNKRIVYRELFDFLSR